MKDLRKNQESLIVNAVSDQFSFKRFISKWGVLILSSLLAIAIIAKPELIAKTIGNWVTKFFGTLCDSIKIEGVTSFNFILIVVTLTIAYKLVTKWIRSKNPDKISGRGNMFS